MQVRFKFEDYVEGITITVRANELIVGLPEPKRPRWETEGLVKVEPAPLPYGVPAYGTTGKVEVQQGNTLYEVFKEAGELDDLEDIKPVAPKRRKPRKKSELYRFDEWYSAYPRKTNRGMAEKAWEKLQPDDTLVDTMIRAVALQVYQPDWLKDGGAFIPHPGTWLNNKRWLDEIPGTQKPTEALPYADKAWGAFIKEGQPHEVLNLMQSVGLDDTEAVLEKWLEDGLEVTCDWLWGMRAAQ